VIEAEGGDFRFEELGRYNEEIELYNDFLRAKNA
jgi:hypothetical protein